MYIETERMILRNAVKSDAEPLAEIQNTPFVQRHNLYGTVTAEQMVECLAQNTCVALERRQGGVIGCIYIKDDDFRYRVDSLELSGWVSEECADKGYMTEALQALIDYLFKTECHDRLTARVYAVNTPSLRLMERVGFKQEGYLQKAIKAPCGRIYDLVLFSISKDEYLSRG